MIVNEADPQIDAKNGIEKSSASPPSKIQQVSNNLQSIFNRLSTNIGVRNERR